MLLLTIQLYCCSGIRIETGKVSKNDMQGTGGGSLPLKTFILVEL
jgi:hypothetical protein